MRRFRHGTWIFFEVGIAQIVLASRHATLEQVDGGIKLDALPVWLVMSEEVRHNARVRRVADSLSAAVGAVLRP